MVKTLRKKQTSTKTKKMNAYLDSISALQHSYTGNNEQQCTNFPNAYNSFEKDFDKQITKSKTTNTKIKKELIKQLLRPFTPSSITSTNDFYNYINYKWLDNIELEKTQKYITQIDDFRLIQYKVYRELDGIVNDYIENNNDELSKELGNYYKSAKKLNSINSSKQILQKIINEIDELRKDKKNLWKMLAYINRNEIVSGSSPLVWNLFPDNKQSNIYRCYLDSHIFSIIDINVYYDDGKNDEYKKNYRNEFKRFVKKLFNTCLENENINTDDVYNVEVELFNAFGCTSEKDNINNYNKVYAKDALTKYKFNWEEFCSELGFQHTPEFFITSSLNYLKCCTGLLLEEWNSEKWRPFWIWGFMKQICRFTNDWRHLFFEFYGKYSRGQELIEDINIYPITFTCYPFNTFLTNKYIEKYKNEEYVKYFRNMAEDLKIVFMRIIGRNTWLSPKTKKYALMKLKKINFLIGSPKQLREDPFLDYKDDEFWKNNMKLSNWRHEKLLKLEGEETVDIPVMDWNQYPAKLIGTQAYVVNASYTPSKNEIYIPLGYVQKPFVDLDERGIEYNLAHLGFTIGHELSHALDDWGSQYDYKGNLNDWWTPEDKTKFKQIQKDIIKQYEVFAKKDGIDFDASIGIGENLADISSLALCEEYLKDFQDKNKDIVPIKSLSFQVFYVYFAFQMRQKITKKALSAQLKTNPHPLDKYRTNVPLTRSELFRAIYNVKKGDGMYWSSTNTVW